MSEEKAQTEEQVNEQGEQVNEQGKQEQTSSTSGGNNQEKKAKIVQSQNRKVINASAYSIYNKTNNSVMSTTKSQNSHSQSMGSLYQAKQVHKNTNIKLNVITNRINKLSQEENMLKKKADDIKEKASQIYDIKRREQLKKQEAKRKRIEVEEVPFTHPVGQLEMIKCQISKKFIQDKHKDDAQSFKSQMAKDFAQKAKEAQINMDNLRWKVQQVRQSEKQSKRKQQEFFMKKLEVVQVDQVSVYQQEKKLKEHKDNILKELEKIEMDQIKQLNYTKQRNRDALDQLDYCKSNLPKDYEDKFGRSPEKKEPIKKINGLPASKFQNQAQQIYLEEDKNGRTTIKTIQV